MQLTETTNPSDALAVLATALWRLGAEAPEATVAAMMAAAEKLAEEEEVPYWAMPPADLYTTSALRSVIWPPDVPTTCEEFVDLVRAIQALDAWHAPLFPRPGEEHRRLAAHEDTLGRRRGERALGEDATGFIIPARLWERDAPDLISPYDQLVGAEAYDMPASTGLLLSLLDRTAYLPKVMALENADHPGQYDGRMVEVRYKVLDDPSVLPRDLSGPIRLGLAPLVEVRHEAQFEFAAGCYAVRPKYPLSRLKTIVAKALHHDVELLLFPEMAVPEGYLSRLSDVIFDEWKKSGAATRRTPALRYVIAGVAGGGSGERHRNFVVMLDRFGREVMRQDKLHRWNLEPIHLERYGLDAEFGVCGTIEEDIEPAAELTLLDVPDLGRIIHLICADSSFNTPGDWLLQHCRTDWVHAPIMDQSTRVAPLDASSQWILKRALRAAQLGHNRVVVTNSMAITHRANETNALDPKKQKYILSDVTLGVLLDAMTSTVRYQRVAAPIPPKTNVLQVVDWESDWELFPL